MPTLSTALQFQSKSPAIIVPETGLHLSYPDLNRCISSLQSSLADIAITQNSPVTISLINGLEFAVSFLAISAQRAIAATLNPEYKQSEVEFYADDIKAVLMIVPKGAIQNDSPVVRAARKFHAGIAEIWWDGYTIQLSLKENGKYLKPKQKILQARPDDIAVTLFLGIY
jgi:oxalate---CoA ligase